jgi:XTP/dITP diphosphohydrolase
MSFELKGRFIFFVTNNIHKFNEARRVLAESKISVGMLRIKSPEIQSESLEEIAQASVIEAFRECRLPVIVEDAGLFVDALNGFPGPYASYVYRTVGNEGLLRLIENIDNRKARFKSVVAYLSSRSEPPKRFDGTVEGEIVRSERRRSSETGFGFDPVFKPHHSYKTFAQMSVVEKCKLSHRAAALRRFAEWYR